MKISLIFEILVRCDTNAPISKESSTSSKSLNFEPVKFEDLNFYASVLYNGSHICSAVIFSTSKLITTARCVLTVPEDKRNKLQAIVGKVDGLIIPLFKPYIHPRYNGLSHDFAVLLMNEYELKFGTKIGRATFLNWDKITSRMVTFAGFISNSKVNGLVSVTGRLMDQKACKDQYMNHTKVIPEHTVCGIPRSNEFIALCESDKGG